jgi:hypothetical protein
MPPIPKKLSPNKLPPAKPVVKKLPVSEPPGLLGGPLVGRLKTEPAGASTDGAALVEVIGALPAGQLEAAVASATPNERNAMFNSIPGRLIDSFLAGLPVGVLAPPSDPAPPPPSPTGGPPSTILQTTYLNAPFAPATTDPLWAEKISGGQTIGFSTPPPWEWVSAYHPSAERDGSPNNPIVGVTGWAVAGVPPISEKDVWFVHPFGKDFQYFIVPDPEYDGLLAASNTGVTTTGEIEQEFHDATHTARAGGLEAARGVLGVEIDKGLVPGEFQELVSDGTRVATFGRWIVDCGHDDFHTEIHPPLLQAVAKPAPPPAGVPGATEMTSVQIVSRPYMVSQHYEEGNFIDHLIAEVAKVEDTFLGIPSSWRVEAHPTVIPYPCDAHPHMTLLVQPPAHPTGHGVLPALTPHRLTVNFHFTHRVGVSVRVFDAGNGTVGITIVFGDLNPAALTTKRDDTVSWDELESYYHWIVDGLQVADLLVGDVASAIVLQRGILTDLYDPVSGTSPVDDQNVAGPIGIDALNPTAGISEEDEQPIPIYGWLNVYWEPVTPVAVEA